MPNFVHNAVARGCLVGMLAMFAGSGFLPAQSADSAPPPVNPTPAAAQSSLSPAAASVPDLTHDFINEADLFVRKGDFQSAILAYQNLLLKNPQSAEAYAGLARIYLKQNEVQLASDTVAKGLLAADSWPLHIALGEVEFRQGRIGEAEREWVAVINGGHPQARAYLGLARVRRAIAMNKTAAAYIEKAHQLDPEDPDVQRAWFSNLGTNYLEQFNILEAPPGREFPRTETLTEIKPSIAAQKNPASAPHDDCHLTRKFTSTQTKLERLLVDPIHLRGYGLVVNVNGQKLQLMLDTGSSGILINRRAAEKAGIVKESETRIGGLGDNGMRTGYRGLAHSIKIGDLEFQDCPVDVWDQRSVVGEEGLIGADVFQDFLVELDFPKEKLRLSDLPKRPQEISGAAKSEEKTAAKSEAKNYEAKAGEAKPGEVKPSEAKSAAASSATPITLQSAGNDGPGNSPDSSDPARDSPSPQDRYIAPEMKSYTPVYRFGHDLLVPTKIGDMPPKLFLLDTGALSNQITPAAAREITKVRGDDTTVKGLSGSVKKVYSADKAILRFGHLSQENQDLLAFDLTSISDSLGTEVSGTLGFVLLHLLDIKIDYRDSLVEFNYKRP